MPKARANINVYSSANFRFNFWRRKTVPYDDDTRNCMVCGTKSDRPPCFVLRKGPSMPRRNWSIRREEPSIAVTADLRPFVTHTGLTINTALLTRHPWRVPAAISMQNVNWSTRRPPFFHHFSNYSTPTYVVVVLFVVNLRSKLHTYHAEVPVWHTPVEVADVRFSMKFSVVDGQGKRGNVHIPAIIPWCCVWRFQFVVE